MNKNKLIVDEKYTVTLNCRPHKNFVTPLCISTSLIKPYEKQLYFLKQYQYDTICNCCGKNIQNGFAFTEEKGEWLTSDGITPYFIGGGSCLRDYVSESI